MAALTAECGLDPAAVQSWHHLELIERYLTQRLERQYLLAGWRRKEGGDDGEQEP